MPSALVSAVLPRTMRSLLPRMAASSAPIALHAARISEGLLKASFLLGAPQRALHGGSARTWRVYLSGEIHSDWRERIASGVQKRSLPVSLQSPITSHEDSDDCGAIILGMEEERPNWDRKGATMNLIRTRTLLEDADIVVVRFGEKYRQWNAAYEAGYAVARNKSLITLHEPSLSHMLKEVNAGALAVCEEAEQVVDVLDYVITGRLPKPRDGDRFVPIADRLGKGNKAP
uniref:YtoQ family protein n=1 Tax=Chrysotila carterae TaxID=13221 RepID=A0A7S4C0R4_CHRCT